MSISRGTRFGSYEIVEPIGSGGMGEVYRARDTTLGRDVALKVLPASFSNDAMRVARFEQEAKTLASLNQSNIAHIYGLEHQDGSTGIVMELVDGETLVDRLAQGPIPPTEALRIANQIADALEAAHERAIVHRDLKPANIKIKPDGTVKVLDFGIAKALDPRFLTGPGSAALTTPAVTEAGFILGTAAYMSPEQARGKFVDQRTDIWAFGCVLYEMLTGKAAFLGEDVTTTLALVLQASADLTALPPGVSASVRRTLELSLEKDARKRVADMRDVKLGLAGAFAATAPTLAPQPLWRRALPAAATLFIGAIAGAYFAGTRPRPESVARETTPAAAVTRFEFTPPASAPLANQGGRDLVISPDGKRIAYLSQNPETGAVALWVRELDALEARLIPGTDGSSGTTVNPLFSADGRSVVLRTRDRGIIRVSIDGGPPIKIIDTPSVTNTFGGGTWAADDMLYYAAGRALYRVSAGGGGTPQALTDELSSSGFVVLPVPLPGGHGVLYAQIEDGVARTGVLDLDTGKHRIILEGAQDATYSATGHIVFARGTTLMAVPFDAKELAVTGEPVAVLQDVRHPSVTNAAQYALSASGTLAYIPSGGGDNARSAVVWVDRAGMVVGRAVNEPVDGGRDPALSPDGTRLVLTTGPVGNGDVWLYDLRGRQPIRLAVTGDNRSGVWSPDGKRIVFTQIRPAVNLYTVLADGSMLTPEPLREQPVAGLVRTWSAAGELFMVTPQGQSPDIAALRVAGSDAPRRVVATEYAEADPALSPDGRWLAYVSNRTGTPEIWVQGYPEGPLVRVSSNRGYEPRWSADGRELFYLQATAMMAVKLRNADDASFDAPEQLFLSNGRFVQYPDPSIHSYDVARDGRFLMFETPGASEKPAPASIVVVENWAEELKKRVPKK
jgi:Tol biopolymer transport system component